MKTVAAALAVLVLASVAGAGATQRDTTRRTIVDRNGDNRLEFAAGEARVTRADLGGTPAGRPRALLAFAHLADTQMVDEESPGRVELVDFIGGDPFSASYRPQEGLMPFVLNEQVRAVRSLGRGPVTNVPIRLAMTGGDNVDNAQLNETRWFIDIMDGGRIVNPDSGRPRTCGLKKPPLYSGMRGGRRFYEPNGRGDGPGYSPSMATNRRAIRRSVASRDYPGLFEQMNRPFRPVGLGGIPWYSVFGNHDGLVQGNFAQNGLFDNVVVSCRKVTRYSKEAFEKIRPKLEGGVTSAERAEIIETTFADFLDTWGFPRENRGLYKTVPSDPRRRFLRKQAWIREHFTTRGRPQGHGFTQTNLANGEGYYSFSPAAGVRFVVVDTVADSSSSGNMDEAQYRWLDTELAAAEGRRELILVFGHHSLRTLTASGSSVRLGPDVEALLLRHPGVIAYVAGHEHRNRIEPHTRFWEIVTASHLEWPQQSRVIELAVSQNGDLAIYTTAIDHTGPPRPTGKGPQRLASIARELSLNEPQAENGENGWADRRGTRPDRNAALLLPNPYG
ncbi:MAG: metallophosphoesterase [Actinomycetota bacterium]|nr:metallophosphoesterase [Actinomycetota bacterium]